MDWDSDVLRRNIDLPLSHPVGLRAALFAELWAPRPSAGDEATWDTTIHLSLANIPLAVALSHGRLLEWSVSWPWKPTRFELRSLMRLHGGAGTCRGDEERGRNAIFPVEARRVCRVLGVVRPNLLCPVNAKLSPIGRFPLD